MPGPSSARASMTAPGASVRMRSSGRTARTAGKVARAGPRNFAPEDGARQREPAPGPPFVEVTHEHRLTRRAPEEVLADRPHLHHPERLAERQMRADDPHELSVAGDVGHHRAPVAVAGKVEKDKVIEPHARPEEEDHAEKAVALRAPARGGRLMGVPQARPTFDPADDEDPWMRGPLLVGLLEAEDVGRRGADLAEEHLSRAGRVHHAVPPAPAVDVPADAAEMGGQRHASGAARTGCGSLRRVAFMGLF
jgi:hypothetical protein